MKRQPQNDSLTISYLKRWSIYFSGVVMTVGGILIAVSILVLAGWQWDIRWLKNPWPDLVVMNPVTAMGFLLSGCSLLVYTPRRRSRLHSLGGLILAWLVLAIGLLRLLSVWFPAFWRVDYLLYSGSVIRDAWLHHSTPLVMVPETAIAFLLSGTALVLLPVRRGYGAILHQVPAIALGFVSISTLICYLYGVTDFSHSAVTTPMAAHSALCFLLLTLAILFAAPGKGIMRQITGPYSGSVTARRFIPFALVVPVILTWAVLFSPWRNSVTIQLSAEILVMSLIFCLLAIIGYNTVLLNRRDVANLKVRQALQASEERYGLLVGAIKDHAIVMLDPSGSLVSWNEGAQAITGHTPEEVIGRKNGMFYSQKDVDEGIPEYNLRQAAEHGQYHREGWRPRKDGTRYWAEVTFTAIRKNNGRLQGFAVIVRDSTERKQAQEKIAYQARLIEDSSDAIFAVDADYRFTSFNKAAEALYGYTAAEVIGQPINDILRNPLSDEKRAGIRRELLEVGYWRGVVVYHHRNKAPLDIAVSISRTQNERGQVDGYIMVCRDMTERLKAEAKLRQFNEELERQVAEKTTELTNSNRELRELTSRLQRVREEERGAIAREIHDELGQQLTGLKMDLSWVVKRLDNPATDLARQKLRTTISLLDETIQTVRRIATDLRPSILDDLGLIAAIEWQSQEFEKRAGIRTVFQSTIPDMDFPPDIAIGMFRICQESLTNVARHAFATHVLITLDSSEGGVCMAITDDGRGLDPRRSDPKTLGLIGIKERALMMGGQLEIGNGETRGFRLAVTVPVPPVLST